MKVVIIGGSIAGSALAYLLAKEGIDVVVYEQKARKNVGKKVCANVYTFRIKKILKDFGINYENLIKNGYNRFNVFSTNNQVSFPTEEYEFDRVKLIEKLIRNAEMQGVKFVFNARFIDVRRKDGKFIANLRKNHSNFADSCDILVGADGALSEVARKAGLWQNRKFFLTLQAKVLKNQIKNKKYLPEKKEYNLLLGKKFGYYSYIFSSRKSFVVGLGDRSERNVKKEFENFLKFLGIKKAKIEGALLPEPKVLKLKKGIFLIGDAGCQIKFSGGGVIPAFMAAKAVKEILTNKNWKAYKKMNYIIKLNRIAVNFLENISDKRADHFLEIVKNKKFRNFPKYRDFISKSNLKKLLDPKTIVSVLLNLFS